MTINIAVVGVGNCASALYQALAYYSDPNNKGEVSHFQALTTALSGTVGLGNIAGVAIAISLGGPGATFWMIVAGLIGMSSKFVECTLGVKYRKIDKNGVVSGGPMYYLRDGLAKKNLPNLGKALAVLFAILCVGGSIGGQRGPGLGNFRPMASMKKQEGTALHNYLVKEGILKK